VPSVLFACGEIANCTGQQIFQGTINTPMALMELPPKSIECAEDVHLGLLRPGGMMMQDFLPARVWWSGGGSNPDEVKVHCGSKAANLNFMEKQHEFQQPVKK